MPMQNKNSGEEKSNNKTNNSQKKITILEICLVIFTASLAFTGWLQYCNFKDFTKKNSRAHLVVVEPQLTLLEVDEQIRATYIVRNDGQTPAYKVRDVYHLEIIRDPEKPEIMPTNTRDFNYPIYGSGVRHIRKVHSGKQILTPKLYAALSDTGQNSHGIYLWGKIKYVDIFDEPHSLTFCFRYVFDEPIGEFRTYGTCNDADRN